ncbi:MAG: hypothetical protein HY288_06755 [Planctomycetia bacterium]|nr:hypothetical protein [Planctomycetia bacterium]
MRKLVLGIAALVACALGSAAAMAEDLEILDPQIAQAFAQALVEAADKIEKPQVKVEADSEKACGVHKEQVGLILVPQKDIQPENEAVNKDPGAPLAHLFMSVGYFPVVEDKPVDQAKLRTLTFTGQDGAEHKVSYLTLAARHTDDDAWHLYGYGTDEKPLIDARIGEGAGPGTQPLALEVKDVEDGTGTAYITIFDRFQCSFKVNYKGE